MATRKKKTAEGGDAPKKRAPKPRAKKQAEAPSADAEVVEEAPATPARRRAKEAEPDEAVDAEVVDVEPAEPVDEEPAPEELSELESDDGVVDAAPTAAIVPASERSVARQDPLQAYMTEVNRHRLLSREEEHELAVRLRDTGDVKAAYKLVAANLRLVVKLAHEYHRNPLSLLDLIQEGNIGLMQAVKKYDPNRGVKLSTYAAWWIRAYILRYIMDNWKLVKLGTTEAQRKLFFKLRQEQDRLANQGIEVTPKLLAERLNVTEQDIVEMDQRLGHDEVSIDTPMGPDDEKGSRLDRTLPSHAQAADDRLAGEQLKQMFREKVAEFAQSLNEKERYIFDHRLMADEPMTLQEIGDNYGVSRERARQIEAALISRMREYMRQHIPDFDLVAAPKD